jgi:hypothetical protein
MIFKRIISDHLPESMITISKRTISDHLSESMIIIDYHMTFSI